MRGALVCVAVLVAAGPTAAASPGARRDLPTVGGVASHAPGDVEIETWYEAARDHLREPRTEWWRVWLGGTLTLSDDTELSTFAVLQQPEVGDGTQGASAARLEMLATSLSYRVLGRTPDGAPRQLEPKLLLEWQLPMAPPQDSSPITVETSQVLDERVLVGGATGRWRYSASAGLAQQYGGAPADEGVGVSFGAGLARSLGELLPWPKYSLGAELFGDLPIRGKPIHALPDDAGVAAYAGPTVSVAVGRFWLTLGVYPSIASHVVGLKSRLIMAFAL